MATTNLQANTTPVEPTNVVAAPVPAPAPAPAPVLTNQKPYRPGLKEWQDKSGLDFNTAASLYNGVIGSNKDTRDWNAIMSAADPVAAARKATYDMYGGVTVKDIDYGGRIIPKLVAADGTILTNPGKRDINFGIGSLPVTAGQATPTPAAPNYEQMVQDAYRSIGRTGIGTEVSNIDQAGFDYWLNALKSGESTPEAFQRNFQTAVSDYLTKNPQDQYSTYVTDYLEGEKTRKAAAADLNKQFGVAGDVTKPTSEGILSGFKYAKDAGLSEDQLRETLGDDVFNTYKTGFADYAKTGIANILADDKLSFDEAREAVKFGRDYGYDSQKLADLTGQKKELFDTINKSYDETADKIIDSTLGAENVKTDTDRVIEALKMQKTYGFTDEDLAKATGYDATKLKSDLDPVRNFGTDLNSTLNNSDLTTNEIKQFLKSAKGNEAINRLYGDNLNNLDTKIAEIEGRWSDFKNVDPMQAERVFQQIGDQREKLGDQYYRGVFGDPMKMAATLAEKGIDSLSDIVQKDKYEARPAGKQYFAPDGTPLVYDGSQGVYGVPDPTEGGMLYTVPKDQVRTEYGYRRLGLVDGEPGLVKFVPLAADEIDEDGNYQMLVGKVAADKDTGKEIADLDGMIAGQNSSGGFKKKWNTLNVQFTKEGVPIVYSTQEKSGLGALVQDLAPIISMAMPFVLPGVGSALSSSLAGVGGSSLASGTLLNQALTQGILSGGLTTLGGGNFGKGFLSGAINPVINTGIGSFLPAGLDANTARALTGAGTGVVKGLLQGGDFEDLLGQGVLSGLMNYGLGETTKGLNLTPAQLNLATGIALPLLQGQKISPTQLFTTLASADQQRQK